MYKMEQLTSPVVSELTNNCPLASNASPTGRIHSRWHLVKSAAWTIKLYALPDVLDAAGLLPDHGILRMAEKIQSVDDDGKQDTLSIDVNNVPDDAIACWARSIPRAVERYEPLIVPC